MPSSAFCHKNPKQILYQKGMRINLKNKIYTNSKGFTTAEIIISVIIIVLFVSLITSSFYNYYISIQSKNRRTVATNSIIDVIENVEMMEYDNITEETINNLINTLINEGTIPSGYTVTATLKKYNETEGNADKKDLIKILKVRANYTINNRQENLEITRLITK